MVENNFNIQSSNVEIKNLTKKFPAGDDQVFTAVDDVNLHIDSGELVTLLGPSGCGKTTTLRMIAGFEYPSHGQVFIGEEEVTNTSPNKRNVGMVFQNYALFPHLTVQDNVGYGLDIRDISKEEKERRIQNVLEVMQIEELADRQPQQLSGGQQQRVSLARTLVIEPRVLLFDEPLSNLDAKLREYMRDEIREIQQRLDITSIYVTHDQAEAMAISDRVVIMNEGKVQQFDSPLNIYMNPTNHFVSNFIGKADFIPAQIESVQGNKYIIDLLGNRHEAYSSSDKTFTKGDQVDTVLRPEFWEIDPQGEFEGIVKNRSYLGDYMEYVLNLGAYEISINDYSYFRSQFYDRGDKMKLNLKESLSLLERN